MRICAKSRTCKFALMRSYRPKFITDNFFELEKEDLTK